MLLTISPAKTLDFKSAPYPVDFTIPHFIDQAEYLIGKIKNFSPRKLKKLLDVSPTLSQLNYERYQSWELPITPENAKKALDVFKGDVYQGLDVATLNENSIGYLNKNLLILSGLYGALRPSDLMLPYRLEMGSPFKVTTVKNNLYKFWGDQITEFFNQRLEKENTDVLINLASNEYFKSVKTKKLNAKIITPEFKDEKDGNYKMISFFAKKARGMMVRFIAHHHITNPENLKAFDSDGYYFNNNLSNDKKWVFTRDH
jgi:cytoplasmic iron level regulating protein YaaA (DUF328/UPF0246 family)